MNNNNITESKTSLAIRLYQLICGCPVIKLQDIPSDSLAVIMVLGEKELKSSAITMELTRRNISEERLAKKYGVSRNFIRERKKLINNQ